MNHVRYLLPMCVVAGIVLIMQALTYTSLTATLPLGQFHYDKIQHFGAGASCGILGCYLLSLLTGIKRNLHVILSALGMALAIGVLWEVVEHVWPSINGGSHSYLSLDTRLDIVLDVLGGLLASLFYRK